MTIGCKHRTADTKGGYFETKIKNILASANIIVNGDNPWDIQVLNPKFYREVLLKGSLGLGESYVNGWWEVEQLDQTIAQILASDITKKNRFFFDVVSQLLARYVNLQKRTRAFNVGKQHYDIGNDLYEKMLDKSMVYTCGYWKRANSLDDAQTDKLDLVCRKLNLKPGMKLLDIGCGWGSLAKYVAQNYGVKVFGVTVSQRQLQLAKKICRGLPIELKLQDYREIRGQFDAVASLGMFEHVGHKNFLTYMQVVERCLKPDAKFLLQTIGKNESTFGVNTWIAKYIFPNGEIPSLKQIAESLEPTSLLIEDVHNFSVDYEKTLLAWFSNFHNSWAELKQNYSAKFYRMWKYYLLSCAGAFRARDLQLWQFVISKGHPPIAYRRPE